jgi:hypothetical protein
MDAKTFQKLRFKNMLAFSAHAVALGASIIGFQSRSNVIRSTSLDRIAIDPNGTLPDQCVLDYDTVVRKNGSINFANAIYLFFGISALAHLYYAFSPNYRKVLEDGWNPYRWFEYALSAAVMSSILAAADGTRDAVMVVTLGLLTGAMQFTGLANEANLRYNVTPNKDSLWASFLVGWFLFIILFGTIGYNFIMAIRDVSAIPNAESFPGFVYFVFLSQIFFYFLFGITQRSQAMDRLKGFKRFEMHEDRYILLSLSSKIALAGGFAYGLIFRTRNC